MSWVLGLITASLLTVPQDSQLGHGGGVMRDANGGRPDAEAAYVVDAAYVERVSRALAKKSKSERERIFRAVRSAVDAIDDPYLNSLRGFAGAARRSKAPRRPRLPWRDPAAAEQAGDPELREGLGFPVNNQYRFGFRSVIALPGEGRKRGKRAPKFPASAPAEEQILAALRGCMPDLDLAVAGLLRALDDDRSADRYACFLECWRNGDESFYRALDRTAGREASVFFYDTMLEDYLQSFVPKKAPGSQAIRRGNNAAHDALHSAFLGYRQYRGLREAVAMALVIPPSLDLPPVLARYEEVAGGGLYSIREQVDILLRIHRQDATALVRGFLETAPPLPEHLWAEPYDPFPGFREFYAPSLERTDELDGDSDALLEDGRQSRIKSAARVANAARQALSGLGIE